VQGAPGAGPSHRQPQHGASSTARIATRHGSISSTGETKHEIDGFSRGAKKVIDSCCQGFSRGLLQAAACGIYKSLKADSLMSG